MPYLGLALFAEGGSDHHFLRPLLRRATESACLLDGSAPVELGDVLELHSPRELTGEDRATRIAAAAREARGAWHLLFVHTDAGGDPEKARRERIDPAAALVHGDQLFGNSRVVGVLPVRETEAWALADGDAVRFAFGTNRSNEDLGLVRRPRDVERVLDPKAMLQEAYRKAVGRPRRASRTSPGFLDIIGERASLDVLREVPSYALFEDALRQALRHLRVIS